MLVTHDESTFNANDGKRRLWLKNGEQPLRPKGKGKGIMVSGFLTPGGILRVPDHVPDADLLTNPKWPRDDKGKPVREAVEYLEYGKDNYWTGEKRWSSKQGGLPFRFSSTPFRTVKGYLLLTMPPTIPLSQPMPW